MQDGHFKLSSLHTSEQFYGRNFKMVHINGGGRKEGLKSSYEQMQSLL